MTSAILQFSSFLCNPLAGATTQTEVNTILILTFTLYKLTTQQPSLAVASNVHVGAYLPALSFVQPPGGSVMFICLM